MSAPSKANTDKPDKLARVMANTWLLTNHIHLFIYDRDGGDVIPKSVQLAAGRTVQQHKQRKSRRGAFWEDRYHATVVQTGEHLVQCIIYMDLNHVSVDIQSRHGYWKIGH